MAQMYKIVDKKVVGQLFTYYWVLLAFYIYIEYTVYDQNFKTDSL